MNSFRCETCGRFLNPEDMRVYGYKNFAHKGKCWHKYMDLIKSYRVVAQAIFNNSKGRIRVCVV